MSRVRDEYKDAAESRRLKEEAWKVAQEFHGPDHQLTLLSQAFVAGTRPPTRQMEWLARNVLDRMLAVQSDKPAAIALVKRHLSRVLLSRRKTTEAVELATEALTADRKLFGEENSLVARDMLALDKAQRANGRNSKAAESARDAVELLERVTVERDLLRSIAYRILAETLELNHPDQAAAAFATAIQLRRQIVGDHPQVAELMRRRESASRRKPSHRSATRST